MKNKQFKATGPKVNPDLLGYPPVEDIYSQETEETEIDPEDITKNKTPNEKPDTMNEKGPSAASGSWRMN